MELEGLVVLQAETAVGYPEDFLSLKAFKACSATYFSSDFEISESSSLS
jgi:hypothetical protein